MKKLKRTLALALTGCMAVSMLATGAFAAEAPAYSDVPANAAYAEAVEYLSAEKIMDGIGDGKFGPQNTVTRAMAVTVLGRMAGAEQVETRDFTDVVPNSWYSGYVGWASENGIVQGDGSGHFMPDRLVTSEQLNLMLDRYAALAKKNVDLYDTGTATVTRADLAQRLYALAQADSSVPVMPAVVQLDKGYIMGYEDNGIYAFKGLPYGTADRFKSSVAVESYGTAENPTGALTTGAVPPQGGTKSEASKYFLSAAFMTPSDSDMYSMEDRCLNLNVWTDSLDENAKKPVLVFMHGGGTTEGSSIELKMYDGSYFADYTGVVFVSVNARLNYLGYADLTALGGDANLGLGDMVLSLEWVRDNIAKFGGDPGNVTILGQSGGGTKVSALSSSPRAYEEKLFSKVVWCSGGAAQGSTPAEQAEKAHAVADTVRKHPDFINYIRVNGNELGLTDSSGRAVAITPQTTLSQLETIAGNASDAVVFTYMQTVSYDILGEFGLSTGGFTADGDLFVESGVWATDEGMNEIAKNYTYMFGTAWAETGGRNSADSVGRDSRPHHPVCGPGGVRGPPRARRDRDRAGDRGHLCGQRERLLCERRRGVCESRERRGRNRAREGPQLEGTRRQAHNC